MKRSQHGFTIIEVLMAMAIFATLATIVVAAFGVISTNTRNNARESDARAWAVSFDLYRTRHKVFPVTPTVMTVPKIVCLGVHANTKCGQYTSSTSGRFFDASGPDYTAVRTGLATVGSLYENAGGTISNLVSGPIVHVSRNTNAASPVTFTATFVYFAEGTTCPSGSTSATSLTGLSAILTGVSNTSACYKAQDQKQAIITS